MSSQIWSGDIQVIEAYILECSFRMLDRKMKYLENVQSWEVT